MDGNPISYNDLFNLNDDSVIKNAITAITALKDSYKQFLDVVINGQLTKLEEQQNALAQSAKNLHETTSKLNITDQEHQKLLLENAKLMLDLDNANKKLNDTKVKTEAINKSAEGSVNQLNQQLKEQLDVFRKLGDQTEADYVARKKQAEAISQTKSQIQLLTVQTKANVQAFTAANQSYNQLDAQTKQLVINLKNLEGGISGTSKEAKQLQAQIYANTQKLKEFDAGMNQNFRNVGNYKSALQGIGSQLTSLASGYFGLIALIGVLNHVIDVNKQISDSLSDVRRTASLTEEEVNNLSETLKKIDTRTSLQGLLQIAVIGGQLGIAKDQLAGFTQAVDQLAVTLSGEIKGGAEVVATSLGKINGVFRTQQKEGTDAGTALNKTGSAILALGQDGLATGEFLQDFTLRVAGTADVAKLSLPVILAYGATLEETGSSAEVAGTAFNRLVGALAQKREQFFAIAKIADSTLTLKKFTDLINTDANAALQLFFQGLNKGGANLTSFNDLLKDLGLRAGPARNAIIELAKNQEELNKQVGVAVNVYDKGTLSAEQFKLKNDNLAGSVEKLKNQFDNALQGDGIGKFFKQIVDGAREALSEIDKIFKSRSFNELTHRLFTFDASSFDKANQINDTNANVNKTVFDLQSKTPDGFSGKSVDELRALIPQYQKVAIEAKNNYLLFANAVKNGEVEDAGGLKNLGRTAIDVNDTYKQLIDAFNKARDAQSGATKKAVDGVKELTDAQLKSIPEIKARIKELTSLPDSGILGSATNLRIRALNERLKELRGSSKQAQDAFSQLQDVIDKLQDRLKARIVAGQKIADNDPLVLAIDKAQIKLNILKAKYADLLRGVATFPLVQGDPNDINRPHPELDAAQFKIDQRERATSAEDRNSANETNFFTKDTEALNLYKKGVLTKIEYDELHAQLQSEEENKHYFNEKIRLDAELKLQTVGSKEYINLKKQEADLDRSHVAAQIADAERVEQKRQEAIKQTISFLQQNEPIITSQLGKGFGEFFTSLTKSVQDFAIQGKLNLTDVMSLAGGLAQSFTDISNEASQARLTQLQTEHDASIALAGNNASAKKAIDKKYNDEVTKEKRKQAVADKENAMFQIAINTAIAVTKALPNIPLSVAIGIIGLAEEVFVASKSIPKFFTGREGGPETMGVVNDRGFEFLEHQGKFRIAGEGKETITKLAAGEKVHTHENSVRMIHKAMTEANMTNQFVDNLLLGTSVLRSKEEDKSAKVLEAISRNALDGKMMREAFRDAVSDIPVTQHVYDEHGYTEYMKKKNLRINLQYERRKFGGNG